MTNPEPGLPVGRRIQYFRERTGKSRAVVAGLVGKSEGWVKAVETGRLQPPRLPMLVLLAEVLRVRDLAELTGEQRIPATLTAIGGHAALPAVRDVLTSVSLSDGDPVSVDHVRARLDAAWRARHASAHHRTTLGKLLPDLLRDAHAAVRTTAGANRKRAHAVLAETLNLSQMFLAYQPAATLLWRAADRAMIAAQESGDPRAMAGAVWFLAQAHRDAGEWDEAEAVNREGLRMLEPRLADGDVDLLALWGALQFEAAYTAARLGEQGTAWFHWDEADRAAQRLPAGYYQPWTSFSKVIMGPHAVTVGVELRHGGEAVRQAGRITAEAIPSRPRRARHLIEVARGYHLRGDLDVTAAHLDAAHASAPETIRFNGYARQIVAELLDGPPSLRRQANDLAGKVGLIA